MEHVRVGNDEFHHRHHRYHQYYQHHRHRITVPLLRYMINFYSAIGIPLHKFPPHFDWRTVLAIAFDVIKNIAITAILWYYIFEKDIYRTKLLITMMDLYKPFYSTILQLTFFRFLQIITICYTGYYFAFGHQMVRELDCEPFRAAFRCAADLRQITRIAKSIFVASIAIFIGTHISHFYIFQLDEPVSVLSIAQIPMLYVSSMHSFFAVNIALYQQFGIGRAFAQIEQELDKKCSIACAGFSETELRLYLERLRAIVHVNLRMNRLLAFPFTLFVAFHVSNVVNTTCFVILLYSVNGWRMLLFLVYPLATMWYLVTIATFNERNCDAFSRICECMQLICEQSSSDSHHASERIERSKIANGKVTKIRMQPTIQTVSAHGPTRKWNKKFTISDMITIQEMSLYVEQLRIRLFHLIHLDRHFLWHTYLASAGFVVFIVQTNQ